MWSIHRQQRSQPCSLVVRSRPDWRQCCFLYATSHSPHVNGDIVLFEHTNAQLFFKIRATILWGGCLASILYFTTELSFPSKNSLPLVRECAVADFLHPRNGLNAGC